MAQCQKEVTLFTTLLSISLDEACCLLLIFFHRAQALLSLFDRGMDLKTKEIIIV